MFINANSAINFTEHDDAYIYDADGAKVYLNARPPESVPAIEAVTNDIFDAEAQTQCDKESMIKKAELAELYNHYMSAAQRTGASEEEKDKAKISLNLLGYMRQSGTSPAQSVSVPRVLIDSIGDVKPTSARLGAPMGYEDTQGYIEMLHAERKELLQLFMERKTQPESEPQSKYKPWGLNDVFQELMDRELDIEALYVKAVSMGVPAEVMAFVQQQIELKSQSRMYLAQVLNYIANASTTATESVEA